MKYAGKPPFPSEGKKFFQQTDAGDPLRVPRMFHIRAEELHDRRAHCFLFSIFRSFALASGESTPATARTGRGGSAQNFRSTSLKGRVA